MTLDAKNENKKSFTNFLKKVLTKQIRCDRIYERKRDRTVTAWFSPSGKLCLSENLILGNCVTAARQTLTLFVGVRIPIPQPKNPTSFDLSDFLSKPQAWYIIVAQSAVYIIKGGIAALVSHHAPACIFLRLDDIQCFALMIYRNKLRMIYKAYALICLIR